MRRLQVSTNTAPVLHTKREAADLLRVGESTIDRLIQEEILVAVRIGKSRRITRKSIELAAETGAA
jgi:excisionase family DNA binding protein